MPVYATPQPITVTIDLAIANLRIIASDRTDTIVEVRPSKDTRAADVKAAERTRVEYSNGRLLVKGPKQRLLFGRNESINVTIELPAGSHVNGAVAWGEFRAEDRLGECRFHTDMGDLSLDQTGRLNLTNGYGNVTVDRVVGHADITAGSGAVRIREIDGSATIKNSNGNTTIGEVTGELRLNAANGDISIDRTLTLVTAKTANGNIRIGEVVRGSILLETAYGKLEVGIREGTAAWLDVSSQYGKVRNSLRAHDGPQQSDETAEVRARTGYGDIRIYRST
ncbi:MAG: DUF4097 family beta strand repeat-containing protein [Chloroflexia bacterium]